MIRFEQHKLIIELECHDPAETVINLQEGLCDLIRFLRQDTVMERSLCSVVDLLSELNPGWKELKKLVPKAEE